MKTLIITSLYTLILIGNHLNNPGMEPNKNGGLYLTATDFSSQKLTYEINCANAGDKIRTHALLASPKGVIWSGGEKHAFDKNKVYGYRDCDSKSYRFYHQEAFLIVDTVSFYIYYQYRQEENVKGKGLVKKDAYFFSTSPEGALKELTIANLKASFPGNHAFHYALDANFRTDKELTAYDSYSKTYKLKYLFNQSNK